MAGRWRTPTWRVLVGTPGPSRGDGGHPTAGKGPPAHSHQGLQTVALKPPSRWWHRPGGPLAPPRPAGTALLAVAAGKADGVQPPLPMPGVGGLTTGARGSRHSALRGQTTHSTARELLLRTLEDLSEVDFKRFWDMLAHGDLGNWRCIPWMRLEKADLLDTKNLMTDFYGLEVALDMVGAGGRKSGGSTAAHPVVCRHVRWPPTLPDYRRSYKKAIHQAYSHIKDQHTQAGDSVSLNARYSKLVIGNKHLDKEEQEHKVMGMGQTYVEVMKEQANSSIAVSDLFKPSPRVVVLLGAVGVGKTMMAMKVMLDWVSDVLFVEFDVFYIHCREGNLLSSQASMADLIPQCCPGSSPLLIQMLGQPEYLLFVINGFDELCFSFDCPQDELCSQPWEKRPLEIILSSLFCRRLLPESSLLITTRPAALQKLGSCLQCEHYVEILGFSEAERKDYFYRFFESTEQAAAAFQFIRADETLFTMCLVPIMCTVCTIVKQQLGRRRGLTQSPKTTMGIYLYLSVLLRSLSSWLKQGMPRALRSLCCLAAHGVWKQVVLFEEKEVQKYTLHQREALPLLLNEHFFQRDISSVSTYSFIHLSFQEFFAVLFYLLEGEGEAYPPDGPTRDVKELLESYNNSRDYFMLTVRFLFGFFNKECRRELEEEMGCRITSRIMQELLAWLQNRQKTALALLSETAVICELEVCHCWYELQDKQFVVTALHPSTGLCLRGLNLHRFDQMVLSFSVKNFSTLELLDLGHCCLLWDEPEDCEGPQKAKRLRREQQQGEGKQSPTHQLCEALEKSGCKLKRLRFAQCQLTVACCRALAPILSVNPTLMELGLAGNEDLQDGGEKLLCEGLRRGQCQLQMPRQGMSPAPGGCGDACPGVPGRGKGKGSLVVLLSLTTV
ncbi:LOW QUALITY PROTEIN: NACHT, LRR and PYD domains-containing protein 6 [Porphyrio hochstetteri]